MPAKTRDRAKTLSPLIASNVIVEMSKLADEVHVDPAILADLVIKATAVQEIANRSLHEKGSIYRISEITITASIPPQIGFAIARSGDEAELAAPVGGVASSELADRLASEDEVVDLEGDVLEMLPEQPSTG